MTLRRSLLLVVACALVASACGASAPSLEIGFRRVALDLAFKDEALAGPAPSPEIITRVIPAPAVQFTPGGSQVVQVVTVVPAPVGPDCPTAPAGLAPERVTFPVVTREPAPGVYTRRNAGAITIEAATASFEIPVPERSKVEVSETTSYVGLPLTGEEMEPVGLGVDVDASEPTAEIFEFEITRKLLQGRSVTDTFRYTNEQPTPLSVSGEAGNQANAAKGIVDGDFLYLVRRTTVDEGEKTVFSPSPPIRYLRLNVPEGSPVSAGVTHAGLDRETGVALSVTSQVVQRELVDVCGDVLDTYRVRIEEQFVDLEKTPPETSGNEPGSATFWNIQFDNGLLLVREEVDTVLRTTTEIAGQPVPVIARYRYTSTIESTEPAPLPEDVSEEPADVAGAPGAGG